MQNVALFDEIDISDFICLVLGRDVLLLPLVWKQFHGKVYLKSIPYGIRLVNKKVLVELVVSVFLKESGDALAFGIQCNDIEWHTRMKIRFGGILIYDFLNLQVVDMISYVAYFIELVCFYPIVQFQLFLLACLLKPCQPFLAFLQ